MNVLKFGGTSMGSAAAIKQVISIVKSKRNDKPVVTVVSAMSGTTDVLLNAGVLAASFDESYKALLKQSEERHLETARSLVNVQQQSSILSLLKKLFNEIEDICNGVYLLGELTNRTKDKLMSYGELLSSQLIHAAFISDGVDAVWKDSRELIVTNAHYGNAAVDNNQTVYFINNYFEHCKNAVVIVPGFVARNSEGVTTTLGRGGSDYTAAIIGAAVHAACVEIWTDVSGMMTADPRLVPNAKIIPQVSYQEAMELSHFGAKVIYPPTIQPVTPP